MAESIVQNVTGGQGAIDNQVRYMQAQGYRLAQQTQDAKDPQLYYLKFERTGQEVDQARKASVEKEFADKRAYEIAQQQKAEQKQAELESKQRFEKQEAERVKTLPTTVELENKETIPVWSATKPQWSQTTPYQQNILVKQSTSTIPASFETIPFTKGHPAGQETVLGIEELKQQYIKSGYAAEAYRSDPIKYGLGQISGGLEIVTQTYPAKQLEGPIARYDFLTGNMLQRYSNIESYNIEKTAESLAESKLAGGKERTIYDVAAAAQARPSVQIAETGIASALTMGVAGGAAGLITTTSTKALPIIQYGSLIAGGAFAVKGAADIYTMESDINKYQITPQKAFEGRSIAYGGTLLSIPASVAGFESGFAKGQALGNIPIAKPSLKIGDVSKTVEPIAIIEDQSTGLSKSVYGITAKQEVVYTPAKTLGESIGNFARGISQRIQGKQQTEVVSPTTVSGSSGYIQTSTQTASGTTTVPKEFIQQQGKIIITSKQGTKTIPFNEELIVPVKASSDTVNLDYYTRLSQQQSGKITESIEIVRTLKEPIITSEGENVYISKYARSKEFGKVDEIGRQITKVKTIDKQTKKGIPDFTKESKSKSYESESGIGQKTQQQTKQVQKQFEQKITDKTLTETLKQEALKLGETKQLSELKISNYPIVSAKSYLETKNIQQPVQSKYTASGYTPAKLTSIAKQDYTTISGLYTPASTINIQTPIQTQISYTPSSFIPSNDIPSPSIPNIVSPLPTGIVGGLAKRSIQNWGSNMPSASGSFRQAKFKQVRQKRQYAIDIISGGVSKQVYGKASIPKMKSIYRSNDKEYVSTPTAQLSGRSLIQQRFVKKL